MPDTGRYRTPEADRCRACGACPGLPHDTSCALAPDGWCDRCNAAMWTRVDGTLMGHPCTAPDGTPPPVPALSAPDAAPSPAVAPSSDVALAKAKEET